MFRLVEAGRVTGARYAQIGLRGYWPGPDEFAWQQERGIASFFMHDVRELGTTDTAAAKIDMNGDVVNIDTLPEGANTEHSR